MGDGESATFDTRLDWTHMDEFSPDEAEQLQQWYSNTHAWGSADLTAFVSLLIENDPGALKRYRRYIDVVSGDPGSLPAAAVALLFLYYYISIGNGSGILYEIIAARTWGASKQDVRSTISLAFLNAGPFGANAVAELAADYLRQWDEEAVVEPSPPWPSGWSTGAVQAGGSSWLDDGEGGLRDDEHRALLRAAIEERRRVPAHVRLLARHQPQALKSLWSRYEDARARCALPAQMVPLFDVHTGTIRGQAQRVADAATEAARLGVTRPQLVSTFCWGLLYTPAAVADVAAEVLEPLLDVWECL